MKNGSSSPQEAARGRDGHQDGKDTGTVDDNAKRSISIRINTSDFGRIKTIARRLRVRESDVFRFLLRVGLAEMGPLFQANTNGIDLLSVFSRLGAEMVHHFGLDTRRLNQIINGEETDSRRRIDLEDVELITMSMLPARYLVLRLQELTGQTIEAHKVRPALRQYLEQKYLDRRERSGRDTADLSAPHV